MSTMAISLCCSSVSMASRPVLAVWTIIPRRSRTLLSAKIFRTSSSTTRTGFPARYSSELCRRSSICCLFGGRFDTTRCRKRAVSSSSRSGDSTPLTTTLRARVCSRASSSGDSCLPVNTITGSSQSVESSRIFSSTSNPDMSGKRKSSTAQSYVSACNVSSASVPVPTVVISMSSWPRSSEMLRRSASLSSTTSSRFRRGAE